MSIERINHAVFWVSSVCFILQGVGYLAPAWFVHEVPLKVLQGEFTADGRMFELPLATEDSDGMTDNTDITAGMSTFYTIQPWRTMVTKPAMAVPTSSVSKTAVTQKPGIPGRPANTIPPGPPSKSRKRRQAPSTSGSTETGVGPIGADDGAPVPGILFPSLNTNKGQRTTTVGDQQGDEPVKSGPTSSAPSRPKDDWPIIVEKAANSNGQLENSIPRKAVNDKATMAKAMANDAAQMMYLSVGLWYGRACVNSRRGLHLGQMEPGAEWCTIYLRTNESTLDKPGQMFELRLEASLAVAFSLAGVLISATFCCSQRHNNLRLVFSLGCLFISGAVMAVPVVHTIIEHVSRHAKFVRHRNWMHMLVNTHVTHDLFDHWSVILCAVASLVSIISTFVFTIISYRSSMKPSNHYDIPSSEIGERPEKRTSKLQWIGNGKVTLPPGEAITGETEIKLESGTTEESTTKPESSSTSVRDGGDSTSVDSFEEAQEMTSYKGEEIVEVSDSGYSVIEDADETSGTSVI